MSRKPSRTVQSGWTRRDLLRVMQVAGAGAVGSALFSHSTAEATTVKGTCRLCVMHCGLVANIERDRLVRVEGDPKSKSKGFICMHAHALDEIVHSDRRLTQPLQREGERFVPVGWDEAYEGIASRLAEIRDRYGPEAIAVQTGWPLVRHPLIPMLLRFCAAFGTPNLITVASLCEAAGRMGKALTVGANFWPEARLAKTLIVWGANPPVAAPPFSKAIHGMNRRGHHLIVVDPMRSDLANRAKMFLQIRPGTDGALALGMINHLIARNLYDQEYVREHTLGFDQLAELARDYPLEKVEQITSVPSAKIAAAAELFAAEGPGCVWDGLGVEHHANGVQAVRAIAALQAICGYVDREGGAVLHEKPGPRFFDEPLPTVYPPRTPKPIPPTPKAKPLGYKEHPLYHMFNWQAQGNLLPQAVLEDRPYPVRALILFGSNPAVTSANSTLISKTLDRLELVVSIDPFLCKTGELADFVLPASTFVEGSESGEDVGREAFLSPRAGSRPDWQILFELARALGLGDYFPWSTFTEAMQAPHHSYFEDPAHTVRPDRADRLPRFPTKSGKIELYSQMMADFGLDPLPGWVPPRERPEDHPEFPLILVTGPRTRAFINSQFRQIDSVRRSMPEPIAQMHPEAAKRAGVKAGDRVDVVSPRGRATVRLELTDAVHPDVVVLPAGWSKGNANLLTTAEDRDPVSGFPPLRSAVCRIEPRPKS